MVRLVAKGRRAVLVVVEQLVRRVIQGRPGRKVLAGRAVHLERPDLLDQSEYQETQDRLDHKEALESMESRGQQVQSEQVVLLVQQGSVDSRAIQVQLDQMAQWDRQDQLAN